MKRRLPSFLAGMLTMFLIGSLSLSALAISGRMTLEVEPINVMVNGEVFQPKDGLGRDVPVFVYRGTTYAPLRALAEAYGLEVGYDKAQNLATVVNPSNIVTEPVKNSDPDADSAQDVFATRAEVAHFLAKYIKNRDTTPTDFQDVNADTQYADDIYAMINAINMLGMPGGVWDPTGNVTVAEFSVLTSRLLDTYGYSIPDYSFPLNQAWAGTWYESFMNQMVDFGIFTLDAKPNEHIAVAVLTSIEKHLDDIFAGKITPSTTLAPTDMVLFKKESVKYISIDNKLCSLGDYWSDDLQFATVTIGGEGKLYVEVSMSTANGTAGIGELLSYTTGDYEIIKDDNPFLDGRIRVKNNSLIDQFGTVVIESKREYSSIESSRNIVTLSAKGKKLTTDDFPEKGNEMSDVKGIPYYRGYLEVDGLLEYFGINKTVVIEKKDDIKVLSIN